MHWIFHLVNLTWSWISQSMTVARIQGDTFWSCRKPFGTLCWVSRYQRCLYMSWTYSDTSKGRQASFESTSVTCFRTWLEKDVAPVGLLLDIVSDCMFWLDVLRTTFLGETFTILHNLEISIFSFWTTVEITFLSTLEIREPDFFLMLIPLVLTTREDLVPRGRRTHWLISGWRRPSVADITSWLFGWCVWRMIEATGDLVTES